MKNIENISIKNNDKVINFNIKDRKILYDIKTINNLRSYNTKNWTEKVISNSLLKKQYPDIDIK